MGGLEPPPPPPLATLLATSAAVKTSSYPRCVTSCMSRVDGFTGFKRSSKYSLHRERISFSSIRMLPSESLIELVVLDLLPRKRRMVCQNTCLMKNSWNPTDYQTLPMTSPWNSLLPKLPLFALRCTGIANQMTICPVARP